MDYKRLTAALTQLYDKGRGASTLKFIATSRSYLTIGREFQHLRESQPGIHLGGENPELANSISREINIVIKRRVSELGKRHKLQPEDAQMLEGEITSVKQRTYLWCHLVFAAMEDAIFFSKADMRAKIHELPHTVEEAYDGILRRSSDPKRAKKILHIIVAADRPLRLAEMAEALAFQADRHKDHAELARDLPPPDRLQAAIRDACGLFVVVQGSEIFLIHQTAREFLIRSRPASSSPRIQSSLEWKHSLDPAESHHILSDICIKYLLLPDFKTTGGMENRGQFSLLEYAACNWTHHYRQAHNKPDSELERLALQLCEALYGRKRWDGPEFAGEVSTSLLIVAYFGLDKLINPVLRENKASLTARGRHTERTALSLASERGFISIVEPLLRPSVVFQVSTSINREDRYKRTPLSYAAASGYEEIVQLLLKKGAKVDIRDVYELTPLSWAVYHGHSGVAQLLLDHGAENDSKGSHLETKGRGGRTPLLEAAKHGDEIATKMLLDRGAKVDARCDLGATALIWAAVSGYDNVVIQLLDRGAKIEATTTNRETALIMASAEGYDTTARLLLDRGSDPEFLGPQERNALVSAASKGHIAVVKLLLDRGARINAPDYKGNTALLEAPRLGHVPIVRLLLDRGANVNRNNLVRDSALIMASEKGHVAIARLLLDLGADVNCASKFGTALMRAAGEGHIEIVELLLDRGASTDPQNVMGSDAARIAATNGYGDVARMLHDRSQQRWSRPRALSPALRPSSSSSSIMFRPSSSSSSLMV
ncbi:hypothetical protein PG991_013408 [Apiospora marii]|uniref:Uncharacterized protein n=1 Tax=Apiospora marii TaxID=335849 RepID=A0ABR1R6N0_9PEZI